MMTVPTLAPLTPAGDRSEESNRLPKDLHRALRAVGGDYRATADLYLQSFDRTDWPPALGFYLDRYLWFSARIDGSPA